MKGEKCSERVVGGGEDLVSEGLYWDEREGEGGRWENWWVEKGEFSEVWVWGRVGWLREADSEVRVERIGWVKKWIVGWY